MNPGILERVRLALHADRPGDPAAPTDEELTARARRTVDRLLADAPADIRALPLFQLVAAAGPAAVVAGWKRMMPRGLTMCGPQTVTHLLGLLETLERDRIPGDLLEAGVWRGGIPLVMRAFLDEVGNTDRAVWLADTFAGLPGDPEHAADRLAHALLLDIGSLAAGRADVEAAFAAFGLLDERVRFLEGRFDATLADAPITSLALLRIDADYFEGTRDALDALYPRVSLGGFARRSLSSDRSAGGGKRCAVNPSLLAVRAPIVFVSSFAPNGAPSSASASWRKCWRCSGSVASTAPRWKRWRTACR